MRSSLASKLGILCLFFASKGLAVEPGPAAPVQPTAQGRGALQSQTLASQAAAPNGASQTTGWRDCRPRSQQVRGWDLRPLCPDGTAVTAPVAAVTAPAAPLAPATPEPADDARRAGSRAEPAAPAPGSHEAGPSHWYGWQLLASDAASLLVATVGSSAESSASGEFAAVGLLGYAAAPAVIHLLHDQGARALSSVGMRLAFPALGAAIAVGASSGCGNGDEEDWCQLGWGATGVLIGTLSAIALDAALAREPVPRASARLQFSPQVLVSQGEARLGLSGSF
jgi:hypothetical protein